MTRKRWIQIPGGDLVPADEFTATPRSGVMIIPDVKPFISTLDGSVVNSRSEWREQLKAHGCVEVGNDPSIMNPVRKPLESPPGLRQEIARQIYDKLRYK